MSGSASALIAGPVVLSNICRPGVVLHLCSIVDCTLGCMQLMSTVQATFFDIMSQTQFPQINVFKLIIVRQCMTADLLDVRKFCLCSSKETISQNSASVFKCDKTPCVCLTKSCTGLHEVIVIWCVSIRVNICAICGYHYVHVLACQPCNLFHVARTAPL